MGVNFAWIVPLCMRGPRAQISKIHLLGNNNWGCQEFLRESKKRRITNVFISVRFPSAFSNSTIDLSFLVVVTASMAAAGHNFQEKAN